MNVLSGPKEWNTLKRPNIYFHDEAYKELNELMMQSISLLRWLDKMKWRNEKWKRKHGMLMRY